MDPKFLISLNGKEKKRRNRPEPMDREARFWAKVDRGNPWDCWEWKAGRHKEGYGKFSVKGSSDRYAHRWAYRFAIGEIPAGLEPDHLSRNRACVNPCHLEAVTRAENARRGDCGKTRGEQMRARTHCPAGHPYDEANTLVNAKGDRRCRLCYRAHSLRHSRRAKEAA